MKPIKNFPDPSPPGLTLAIEASGILLVNEVGVWKASDAAAAEVIIATYDPTSFAKAEKSSELANLRWQKETGGFIFQPSGVDRPYRFVSTREAMGPVMGAVLALQAGVFPDPTQWKTAEGIFVPITAADVLPLYKAFAAHVAGAFAEEATKQAQVVAAPWEDVGAISIAVDKDG
jgi:hypothetical protein